ASGGTEVVPYRRVHEVHGDDVDDLAVDGAPPDGRRGGCGVRLGLPAGHAHAASVRGPRPPTAKAGAPRRLTATLRRYSRRPSAMACWVGTPSGVRNSTNAPSRTPSPEIEIGSTWAMSTAGKNARSAVGPTATLMPMALAAISAARTSTNWYANPTTRTLTAATGCRRSLSMPRWTAAAKRRQPPLPVT